MLGGIAGDIIGSPYEWDRIKHKDFPLFSQRSNFTDDSVLTIAVAEAILDGRDFGEAIRDWGTRYPGRGYGGRFAVWLETPGMGPYNSYGNGSAMRVGAPGFAAQSDVEALDLAAKSAECTHNHPEGIKGAQATALAIYLARTGVSKEDIRRQVADTFDYDLSRTVDQIRPDYTFNEICQVTVPEAIICFLDADDYEDTVRNAVSLGGDSDTLACIAGFIADAYYGGVPAEISETVEAMLPEEFLSIIARFEKRFTRAISPPRP